MYVGKAVKITETLRRPEYESLFGDRISNASKGTILLIAQLILALA